jgi:hypothetical protein
MKSPVNEHSHAMNKSRADHTRQPARPASFAAKMLWCGLLSLLLAGLPRPGVAAEAADSAVTLTGLSDATMGVSQLTADGVQCGLELGRIGEVAHQAVADAGIAVRDDSTNRMTISAVTTRVGPDQCATAVLLGVYAKESFFSLSAGWIQSGYVVLWQRSMIVATPVGQHAAAVIDATRRLSEQMLVDWRARNPPPPSAAAHGDNDRAGAGSRVATQAVPGTARTTQ